MKAAFFLGIALLSITTMAWADDEYVDPNFCYRIVIPDSSTQVAPSPDGSGVTMDVGAECPRRSCVHLLVFASYINVGEDRGPTGEPVTPGWSPTSSEEVNIAGTVWSRKTLSKGDTTRVEYQRTNMRDSTRYHVVATYSKGLDKISRSAIEQVLASWRLVSECV